MKCLQCGYANRADGKFCIACGISLSASTAGGFGTAIKVLVVGGITGIGTSLLFIMVHEALTTDSMFDLWEFGVALVSPALIASLVALTTSSKVSILLAIAYLTLLIPVVGAFFGSSGSEPLWQFAALGLVGGLVWSIPFSLSQSKRR
jgi:hypothetical protein